jgi:hypothetical protein
MKILSSPRKSKLLWMILKMYNWGLYEAEGKKCNADF